MEDTVLNEETQLKSWEGPGTLRGKEIAQRDAQQGFGANFMDSARETAAGAGIRVVQDEAVELRNEWFGEAAEGLEKTAASKTLDVLAGVGTLLGFRSGEADYDRAEKYEELTKGVPYRYHEDILGNHNFAGAMRARQRVLDSMERGSRMGLQQGSSSTLALMAGSLVDVDLPLMFMTGGGYQAARVARAGVKFGMATGMSAQIAKRTTSGLVGASSGLQAGLAAGVGKNMWDETADWTMLAEYALTGALMGGAANAALKGDLGLQIRAAQDDLYAKMRTNDPVLTRTPEVSKLRNSYVEIDGDEVTPGYTANPVDSTAGARQYTPKLGVPRIDRTKLNASPREMRITEQTENWRHESGWADNRNKAAKDEKWLYDFIVEGPGSKVANDYNNLLKSNSPTANFLAGEIYESAHSFGRGRATAAIFNEQYQKQIIEPITRMNDTMMQWARVTNQTMIPGVAALKTPGFGIKQSAQKQFGREVMLEIGRRRAGNRANAATPEAQLISEAADRLEESAKRARDIMKGRNGEKMVDGADVLEDVPYTPYTWQGRVLRDLLRKGTITDDTLIADLAQGYRNSGYITAGPKRSADEISTAIAKALVTRLKAEGDGINMSLQDILHADGRAFLEGMLNDAGVSRSEIQSIIDRISGVKEEAGKSSNLKMRNEIDLEQSLTTTDGSTLQIVDLMDQDLNGTWHRYARGVAGSAALARKGITNKAQREDWINAIMREQEALGEEAINPDVLRAMFTNFDSGAIHGVLAGRVNKGMGPFTSIAKRATSVSLLQGLGFAQIAETGATMAAIGFASFAERGIHQRLNRLGREEQRKVMRDLEYITGRIGEDHKFLAPHLELDDVAARDAGELAGAVQGFLGKAQYLNGFTSGFNAVRSWQQTTMALGIMDKVITKGLREENGVRVGWTPQEMRRLELDFGMTSTELDQVIDLVDKGVIEVRDNMFGGKTVDALNLGAWNQDLADEFGASITRSVNQQVQKTMAGEADVWMNNEAMSLLMQFKAFPMQAITKQAARHMRFMDQETLMTFGAGLTTAYVSLMLRDAAYGRERSVKDRAVAAVGYSNMTGFLPMGWDPAMTLAGYEGARVNPYGNYWEMAVPAIDTANRGVRAVGALSSNAYTPWDGFDKGEQQAIKALPLMNIPVLSRLMWD